MGIQQLEDAFLDSVFGAMKGKNKGAFILFTVINLFWNDRDNFD